MKPFQRIHALFLAFAIILSLLPGGILPVGAADPLAPDSENNFLHAVFTATPPASDGVVDDVFHCDLTVGTVKFGAAWDQSNLYLVFTGSSIPNVSQLKINGVDVTATPVTRTNTWEIKIPLATQNITDYSKNYAMSANINGQVWSGYLIFDTVSYASTAPGKTAAYGAEPSADGWSCVLNSFASTDSKYAETDQKYRDMYYPVMENLAASLTQDTIVEFDLTVTYFPEIQRLPNPNSTGSRDRLTGGFNIAIYDGEELNLLDSGASREGLWSGLYKKDGKLYFIYWDDTLESKYVSVPVDDYVSGRQYHLRIEYHYTENTEASTETNNAQNDKVSAKYYINGQLIATAADAKHMNVNYSSRFRNIIFMTAHGIGDNETATNAGRTEVTVSNLYVSKTNPKLYDDVEAASQVDALIQAIGTLVGLNSEPAIQAARKAYAALSDQAKAQVVNLAVLEAAEADLARQKAGGSPAMVDAAFSADPITVDGSLKKAETWRMSGTVLSNTGALVAEYGFQWNQTTLYMAIDFEGSEQALTFTLNGKTFTVSGTKLYQGSTRISAAKVAKNNGIIEISIPMQTLGLGSKVSEYGKTIDATVKAGSYTGSMRKLTLSGIDWTVAVNRYNKAPSVSVNSNDEYHGVQELVNGYRLFDLYGGSNLPMIRSYVGFNDKKSLADRVYDMRMEFDFQAHAMPVLPTDGTAYTRNGGTYACSGFTCCAGELRDAANNGLCFAYGIINTADGLMFLLNLGGEVQTCTLQRELGQKFSIAVEWTKENTLHLFLDGVHLKTFTCEGYLSNSSANASIVINMRSLFPPNSAGDNYDVSVTNISFGNVYRESGIFAQIVFADICGENKSQIDISSDLILPTSITNGQLDTVYPITWISSNPSIINSSGQFTKPATGIHSVTITAALPTGETKSFDLVVYGATAYNDGILHVMHDTDPEKGVGLTSSEMAFTLDATNNSIIRDLTSKQKVNFVVLTDRDDKADLTPETMTLWVSNDNKTYARIKDYKLLQVGSKWYLYDFEAEAQYVKVHYTKPDEGESSFYGLYGEMIDAGYEAVFGGGTAGFAQSQYTLTNNTGADKVDYAWTISKQALGVTGTDASIRIYADGKLLYHYVSGSNVVFRINDLAAGDSVTLTVLSSSDNSVMDISNKEGVHEVIYGVQNTTLSNKRWYYLTLPAGTTFPDGSMLEKETIFAAARGRFQTSTDGGKTWITGTMLNIAPEGKTPVTRMSEGGWIFDSKTGRLMYQTYQRGGPDPNLGGFNPSNMEESHIHTYVVISDDGGKTWYQTDPLPCRTCMEEYHGSTYPTYALSYSDGTELSTNDGTGPNIDFVFPVGYQYDNIGTFACRIAYTTDGGENWQYSQTPITYPSNYGSEGGCSEGWIIERTDGVLVLHVRCQDASATHFKVSYSFDQGLTWTNDNIFTDYYAVNGQAFIRNMEIAGENTVIAAWGGNTSLGNDSYHRNPFVFAASANDGETFRNVQNILFRSFEEKYDNRYFGNSTNVSLVSHSGDDLLFTYRRNKVGDWVITNVEDFDDWFTRTKGAYDNFEKGTLRGEGWNWVLGTVDISSEISRDKYAMKLGAESMAIRSVPYLQDGMLTIDIYVTSGNKFTLELQSAHARDYNLPSTPIALRVEDGKLYFGNSSTASGNVKNGWNTLTFNLGLSTGDATLCINGSNSIRIPLHENRDDYICYINIATSENSTIYVDELLVIDELEPVLSVSSNDEAAANHVLELIKAVENPGDCSAVAAARAAFNQLNQAQQDLVNRRVLASNGKTGLDGMINYYELLCAYEDNVKVTTYLINAIGTVTLQSEADIQSAEEAYAQLTEDQKQQITNYATLIAARATLNQLKEDKIIADKAAAKVVDDQIAALPPVGALTLANKSAVEAARKAYTSLTADQAKYIENLSILEAAEAKMEALRIPSTITSATYTVSGGILSKIGVGTTAQTLLNNLSEGRYARIYNGNQIVANNTLVGTGMTVKILDGNTVKAVATIVVTGDINGDGKITITDMLAAKAHILNKSVLSGAYACGADTSGDGRISITDFLQIKAHILGKSQVKPNNILTNAS